MVSQWGAFVSAALLEDLPDPWPTRSHCDPSPPWFSCPVGAVGQPRKAVATPNRSSFPSPSLDTYPGVSPPPPPRGPSAGVRRGDVRGGQPDGGDRP